MAYIPPHKRYSKEPGRPLPTAERPPPRKKKSLNAAPSRGTVDSTAKLIYAKDSICKWCTLGLEQSQFPALFNLEPVSLESTEWIGEKPLALVTRASLDNEGNAVRWNLPKSPWICIAELVLQDLLSSFRNVRINEMELQRPDSLVVRLGKILFHRSASDDMEFLREGLDSEILKRWKRSFYANVPVSYTEHIANELVPKIGVDFKGKSEMYRVKLSASGQPKSTITCKCSVAEDGKLQICKVRLNHLRNMGIDISCPTQNLDLRFMLSTKRTLPTLTEDEMQGIKDLINSAVLDPNVKGGLRWPLGMSSSGDHYHVVDIWHTMTTTYDSPSLKLKLRHANRFNFGTLAGETVWEVRLFLKGLLSKLQEQNVEDGTIFDMLQEDLRLIWDNFFCCENFVT